MCDFTTAEAKYRELRARMERGESISRSEFEEQVSQLAVREQNGAWWKIHPYTACWMYYDGADWVMGLPPGRERATVDIDSTAGAMAAQPSPMPQSARASAERVTNLPDAATRRSSRLTLPRVRNDGTVRLPSLRRKYVQVSNRRAWIALGVASVILVACIVLIFFGGQLVVAALVEDPTPTRAPLVQLPTPTPYPTVVRQPTLPLPTATPVPVLAKVIERRVNVRAGPSLDAQIVGKIQQDDLLTLIGISQDDEWYRVMIAGRTEPAWVFAETLEVTRGDPGTLPIGR